MTGSGFIDGTRKIHAVFCQRNSKGLIVANPHATVAVFIGEDERSPVYHLRLRHIPLSRQPALRVDGESNVLQDAGRSNSAWHHIPGESARPYQALWHLFDVADGCAGHLSADAGKYFYSGRIPRFPGLVPLQPANPHFLLPPRPISSGGRRHDGSMRHRAQVHWQGVWSEPAPIPQQESGHLE